MLRTIIFWNVGRLFGSSGSPIQFALSENSSAATATPDQIEKKLDIIAATIDEIANITSAPPLFIGLTEIETNELAKKLAKKIKSTNIATIDDLAIDEGGIVLDGLNITLLVDPNIIQAKKLRSHIVDRTFNTRDILEVDTLVGNKPLSLVLNHWPSRLSGESKGRRIAVAHYVSKLVANKVRFQLSELWDANSEKLKIPNKKKLTDRALIPVVIMGDFNDEVFNESISLLHSTPEIDRITDDLKLKGRSLKDRYRSYRSSTHRLLNPFWTYVGKSGSFYHSPRWRTYDQILMSRGLCEPNQKITYLKGSEYIFSNSKIQLGDGSEWNLTNKNGKPIQFDPKKKRGCSDHFPVVVTIDITD